jgi:hypothetical protein
MRRIAWSQFYIELLPLLLMIACYGCGGDKSALPKPSVSRGESAKDEKSIPATDKNNVNELSFPDEQELIVTGDAIDLLKQVDLIRDVGKGEWQQSPTGLIGMPDSMLYLPTKTPEDYQLQFRVRRIEGKGSLSLGFMMAGRQGLLLIEAGTTQASGVYTHPINSAFLGPLFQDGSVATIVVTVHPGHVHAIFDDKVIADWYGDPKRLYIHSERIPGSRETPTIDTTDAKFEFEAATLTPIKPEPALKPASFTQIMDLIPLIRPGKDFQQGQWQNNGALTSPDQVGLISLPLQVPAEYTLSGTLHLSNQAVTTDVTIGLVSEGVVYPLILKADQVFEKLRVQVGIDGVDEKYWANHYSAQQRGLEIPVGEIAVACTVTHQGVRVEINRRLVFEWRGEPWRIKLNEVHLPPDSRKLFLGCQRRIMWTNLKIGPPVAPGSIGAKMPDSAGVPLDLLAIIDPVEDALSGAWKREKSTLKMEKRGARIACPVEPPPEYLLKMRISRMPMSSDETAELRLTLPIENCYANVAIDDFDGNDEHLPVSGLHLDFMEVYENETSYRGHVIPAGEPADLEFHVRRNGIRVTRDGKSVIEWAGNPERLTAHPWHTCPIPRISIGSTEAGFRLEKLTIERLESTEALPVKTPGDDGDLIPCIQVDRDSRMGHWAFDQGRLKAPLMQNARLRIPVLPPEKYTLTVVVERPDQGGDAFLIGFPVGGHSATVIIDREQDSAALVKLDGKLVGVHSNLTTRTYHRPLFPAATKVTVRCQVLPDTVIVACDEIELIRWHGDPRRLSDLGAFGPPNASQKDRAFPWIGAFETNFLIHELSLLAISDEESELLRQSFSGPFPLFPHQKLE